MAVDTAAVVAAESAPGAPGAPPRGRIEERVAAAALALLPGGLLVYFAFEEGGFFPGSVAFAALVLTQIVILRVLLAERPFAGYSRTHAIVVGIFAGYAGWTLASALWSNDEARALVEFDRAYLYLLLLLLFGLLPRRPLRLAWMTRGLAAGALVVCTLALITRVLPRIWPTAPGVADNRLSFPLTYWNALGILASFGIVLMLGITSNPHERRGYRALAAAGVPIAASTLFFTFSRGAIGALALGLVVFLCLGRSRALAGALLAVVPATAAAILVSYHANLLDSDHPTIPAAVIQGHTVAIVVALAALAAAAIRLAVEPLERRLERQIERSTQQFTAPRRTRRRAVAVALATFAVVAVAAGAPAWIAREASRFTNGSATPAGDFRARLTSVSSDGRSQIWQTALKGFASAPIKGTGAGTFEFVWYRYRSAGESPVVNAHNLYLETLSDLGIIGLLLLIGALAAILVAIARRARGPDRVLYAALFSAALAWAVHAGVDWDWQMPAVTAWLFAIGGAALAADGTGDGAGRRMADRGRVPLAAALLVAAVTPALLMLSEYHLQSAADAFQAGDCTHADSEAIASISVIAVRPEPYQILGYCDITGGQAQAAVAAMRKAVRVEPGSWEFHYGLAIADSYAGIDPRPQLLVAMRLDPHDRLIQQMAPVLGTSSPRRWLATAQTAYAVTVTSGRLTLR